MIRTLFALICLSFGASLSGADSNTIEAGERELTAPEIQTVLHDIADVFKAHPSIQATIRSETEDLTGKRTENGELLLDRSEGRAASVLRTFSTPRKKIWLLKDNTISEYLSTQNVLLIKDFSAAPKMLSTIQAATTGDIQALTKIFSIQIYAKDIGASQSYRLILDKTPGQSPYIQKRIEARINKGESFFNSICYIPQEGDELTEYFTDIKEVIPDNNKFLIPKTPEIVTKTDKISD